jgi:hypothetical protein
MSIWRKYKQGDWPLLAYSVEKLVGDAAIAVAILSMRAF